MALATGSPTCARSPGAQLVASLHSSHRSGELFLLRPADSEAKYCDERVCVCVCLSVSDRVFGTTRPIFTKCPLRVTCGRGQLGPPGGVAIRYVLPVLWMTSNLLISQGCSTSPPGSAPQPWAWL